MSTGAIRATVFSMSLAACLAVVTKSQSQDLLLYEPFDYPNGEALNVQADWNGDAPLDGLQILNDDGAGDDGSSSLQYFNLPGQGGRVRSTQRFGGDAEILLPSAITGEGSVLYVSFLYKPIEAGNSYFAHNITTGSTQNQLGRWDSRSDNAPATTFAARWRDSGTRVLEEEPDGHESGETIFVVAKTTLVPGVDNDTFDLWIDPDPGRPEPAPSASTRSLAGAGNDINPDTGIVGFSWRVSNSTGQFEIDELRLGTTWESVTADLVIVTCSARRTVSPVPYHPGREVTVTVTAKEIPGPSTITENVPEGWTVVDAGGGVVDGTTIGFSLDADAEVSYVLTAPGDSCGNVEFTGTLMGPDGCAEDVSGDSTSTCSIPVSLPFYESFDYPNGEALKAQENWSGTAPPEALLIVNGDDTGDNGSSSLEVPGLPSGGGRVRSTEGLPGGCGLRFLAPITPETGELYVSFLYKPIVTGNSYFAHNDTTGSIQGQLGRWESRDANSPSTTFAARWRDSATRVLEPEFGHEPGTTVFLVARSTLVNGDDNDTFDLWIDPEPGDPEPLPTASATSLLGAGNDVDPAIGILGFVLRVSGGTGEFEFDELRIGTTWESVTVHQDKPIVFRRGDTDGSGSVDISDPIFNLTFQFVGGIELLCRDAADVDDSGVVDISDPIYNLTFQFVGGIDPPPAPGPTECGPDPTDDALGCENVGRCL